MDISTMEHSHLIWQGIHKLPKVFSNGEVNILFNELAKSKEYWNHKGYKDWGEFLKLRDICLVATIYILGLRPKEACCLKFSDFDFKRMWVHISGENNKTRKDRKIPMPKLLMEFYTPYLQLSRARFWRGSEYLFPSFMNDHISPERLKHIFREKCLKPAGLWEMPKKSKYTETRLYALRHTRASEILKKQIQDTGKADLHAIANILGHSDLRSTQIYLHTDEEYMDYTRNLMEM